jgi:hypothetical protein
MRITNVRALRCPPCAAVPAVCESAVRRALRCLSSHPSAACGRRSRSAVQGWVGAGLSACRRRSALRACCFDVLMFCCFVVLLFAVLSFVMFVVCCFVVCCLLFVICVGSLFCALPAPTECALTCAPPRATVTRACDPAQTSKPTTVRTHGCRSITRVTIAVAIREKAHCCAHRGRRKHSEGRFLGQRARSCSTAWQSPTRAQTCDPLRSHGGPCRGCPRTADGMGGARRMPAAQWPCPVGTSRSGGVARSRAQRRCAFPRLTPKRAQARTHARRDFTH